MGEFVVLKYYDVKLDKNYYFLRYYLYPNNYKTVIWLIKDWRDRLKILSPEEKVLNLTNFTPLSIDMSTKFINYTRSFCKFCKNDKLCLRHKSILDLPLFITTHDRFFAASSDKIIFYKEGWLLRVTENEAIIERPSGIKFTYRNHSANSSYQYLLTMVLEHLEDVIYTIMSSPREFNEANEVINMLFERNPGKNKHLIVSKEAAKILDNYFLKVLKFHIHYNRDSIEYTSGCGTKIIMTPEFDMAIGGYVHLYYYP